MVSCLLLCKSRQLTQIKALAATLLAAGFVYADNHAEDSESPVADVRDYQVEVQTPDGSQRALDILTRNRDVDPEDAPQSELSVPASEVDARIIGFLSRLQTLEREYSVLQGRVEELEHYYQEERHLNRKRFLDLDRRLRELTGGQMAPEDVLTAAEAADTEGGLYRAAIAAINDLQYDEAKSLLDELINTYPNGEKVADAMYWLAELNHNIEPKDLEQARQYFIQMTTLYSDHAKIPEALAKLGMIYHELGNEDRALEYLDRVVAEFPSHDAARLAQTYAQDLRVP